MIKRESQVRALFRTLPNRPGPVSHTPQFRHAEHEYFAFEPGQPCRLERPISPGELVVGQYWSLDPQRFGAVRFNGDERALEMEGFTPEAVLSITTAGPVMRIPEGRGFRFRALVKSNLAPGAEAFLELHPILYSFAETDAIVCSAPLGGCSDWRELTVSVPPLRDRDFIAPRLRLKGRGIAWFKDMILEYAVLDRPPA